MLSPQIYIGFDDKVVLRGTKFEDKQNYDPTHHYSEGVRKDHVERGEDSKTLTQ